MADNYNDYEKLADSVGMPAGMDNRIVSSIKQEYRKNRPRRNRPAMRVAVLLIVMVAATDFMTGGALIFNRLRASTQSGQISITDDTVYLGNYSVNYIPDGFRQVIAYDNKDSVEFQKDEAHIFVILLDDETEIAGFSDYSQIEINGKDALLREKELNGMKETSLIVNFVDAIINIRGNLSSEEAIKISKNIIPVS